MDPWHETPPEQRVACERWNRMTQCWEPCEMPDIRQGDIFRQTYQDEAVCACFDDDGFMIEQDPEAVALALGNAYKNPGRFDNPEGWLVMAEWGKFDHLVKRLDS